MTLKKLQKSAAELGSIPFGALFFHRTMPALITVGLVGFISAARDISTVVLLGSGKSRTLSLLMLGLRRGRGIRKSHRGRGYYRGFSRGPRSCCARQLGGQVRVE